jgi:VanZ family protein
MAFVVAVAYAVTDELHQVFVPGRVPEWGDLVADASGAFLFLLLLALKRARAPSGTPPGN